jgi:hypothetical protein
MASPWNDEEYKRQAASGIGINPLGATTSQAAQANLATKSANTPYVAGADAARGGVASGGRNGGDGGQRTALGQTPVATSQGQSQYIPYGTSNEWWGGLDEYGSQAAAASPGIFFDLYGTQQLGLQPGSATAAFMNETYNPYAIASAFGGGGSVDQRLAQGNAFSNIIGQPGTAFFNPGQIVTSVLSQIASGGKNGEFSQLAGMMQGMDPMTQVEQLVSFLGEALKGSMAPDALQSYLNWIQQKGMVVINQVMTSKAQGGGLAEFEKGGGNIATALLRMIGPNGGL